MPDDDRTTETTETADAAEMDATATDADAGRDAEQTQPTDTQTAVDPAYVAKLERENKKRVGDLAALKKELAEFKTQSTQQRDALAKALGLKSDEATPEELQTQLSNVQSERDALAKSLQAERVQRLVLAAAQAAGAADTEVVLALINPQSIEVGDDGNVKADAVKAAVDDLKKRKPRLFESDPTEPKTPLGGTKPGQSSDAQTTFKRSQLADPEFYAKHRDAILVAANAGRIVAG